MIFCVMRAIANGPSAGIYSALGVCFGLAVHAVAAGLGLSELFVHFPVAYKVLRIGGAAYLLWLAWQTYNRNAFAAIDLLNVQNPATVMDVSAIMYVAQGALNALLSPKAVFFYLVLFPQFLNPAQGSILVQSLFLITIINVINFTVIASLCLCAGRAARWLVQHPRALLWQQRCVAGVFIALAARVLFSKPVQVNA